ncbi:DNA cytosine methyltransferase [Clostridium perfringens]|uniref:DNA cytosine methyltransferase n=1 Tax=Clostridium perfringens TaxID=1502 RepID=UPI0039E9EA62
MKNNLNKERGLDIKHKRTLLDITRKEFSDALGLTREEEKLLKHWEDGSLEIPDKKYKQIMKFPTGPSFPAIDKDEAKFTFIDLFAGIGGIRLAFHNNGGRAVFSSEFDKFAQKTYRINYGEIPSGDITLIEAKDIPNHDILVGGFPCQPFSKGGLKKGFDDTRGTLFFDIARILKEKRPKAFMLENVKQLRGHNGGETLATMLRILEDLNYEVPCPEILRSYEFGIPQNRERIIIVGFNRDYITDGTIRFEYPTPNKNIKTRVGDILEDKVDDKYTISDKLYQGHIERKQRNKANGKGFGASFIDANSRYTNTISARYYKDGSEALVLQEGKNPRMLTPRECARLQGFPENFIIPVSNSQAYKQFGNSVTVPVIEAVAKKIIEYMEKQNMI